MSRLTLLSLLAILALALFAGSAGSASAAPVWEVTSEHAPTNFQPGGTGQYIIRLRNAGDEAQTGTLTVTDNLPAGMVATEVSTLFSTQAPWSCGGVGTSTVTCSREEGEGIPAPDSVAPPNGIQGHAPPIAITVSVPQTAGAVENYVLVSGGGGADVAIVDPTMIDPVPAGPGFFPGSLLVDVFDGPGAAAAPERQAGSHPFELRVAFRNRLALHQDAAGTYTTPVADPRTLATKLPEGLVGDPQAAPTCGVEPIRTRTCPVESQVGVIDVVVSNGNTEASPDATWHLPVYNVEPSAGAVASLGFTVSPAIVVIDITLDPDDRSVVATIRRTPQTFQLRRADLSIWGVPVDPAHDPLRSDFSVEYPIGVIGAPSADAKRPRPFITLPAKCGPAVGGQVSQDFWSNPGQFIVDPIPPWEITGCEDPRIRFRPAIAVQPTSHEAAAPTGLDVDLSVPQKDDDGVTNAADLYAGSGKDAAIATPTVRDVATRLPLGMAINPSVADGLLGCSQGEVGIGSNADPTCPDASKLGTVEVESDLVPHPLKGYVYQAEQYANPHGSLLSFYTVAQGDGVTVKLAARVLADPDTGQLSTVFADNPQLPFNHYRLHFWGGPRAALVNPPVCGTHSTTATVSAWNEEIPPLAIGDSFQLTSGPNGTPCPSSLEGRPFDPTLTAGSATPIAGTFSSFALDVGRPEGTQELRGIDATLPPGLSAALAGVPYCPELAIASISTTPGTAFAQRLAPSCPEASRIGHSDASAGAGSMPLHNPGSVYLAGPYKGAPLSLAVVTPVIAGPLDLGSIVVRAAVHVDPLNARIRVVSDPIPDRIVADGNGLPLNLRSVGVTVDRPRFALNPTNCEAMSVGGTLTSLQGAVAERSNRFQVGACRALAFQPKLGLRLLGGSRRGAHPKLRAVLAMPGGNANVSRVAVALPHSEFLAQDHIGTICTRIQFAAERCPSGSIYGYARAFSPLLDRPLSGPVYLRSSDNPLPDLVAALHGQIDIDLIGRIDSKDGGIRTTFATVPDARVSKFVLTMKGARKGLLENSTDLCRGTHRADVRFDAHNGREHEFNPPLRVRCTRKKR